MIERTPIATMLFSPSDSTPSKKAYELRSVLAPASDRVMLTGDYAPAGSDGAGYAASLIAECTPAPVEVMGSFILADNVVFAQGTTYIEAAWMVLDSAGWCVQIAGDGTVYVRPKPDEPVLVLDEAHASLLGEDVTLTGKLSEVPNRYIAVDGDYSAIAVDDDPGNPASLYCRGRYVDVYDDSPQRVDGESLEEYAERKLKEASESIESRTYDREWADVLCWDIVRGSLASVGLDCRMRVKSQSVRIGNGITVTETGEVLR